MKISDLEETPELMRRYKLLFEEEIPDSLFWTVRGEPSLFAWEFTIEQAMELLEMGKLEHTLKGENEYGGDSECSMFCTRCLLERTRPKEEEDKN